MRNNFQRKSDKTSYNCDNIFTEAKFTERQGLIKKSYFK